MDPKKVRTAFAKIGYSTKGEAMVEAWDQRGEKVAEGSLKSLLQSPFANMDSSYDKYIIPAAENLFDQVKDWLGLLGPYEERVEVCVCLWMSPCVYCHNCHILAFCNFAQEQRQLTQRFLDFESQNECFLDVGELENTMSEYGFNDMTEFTNAVRERVSCSCCRRDVVNPALSL